MFTLSNPTKKVLEKLADYIRENGYAPSQRELALKIGVKSPNTVDYHLKRLEKLGLVECGKTARALKVKDQFIKLGRLPLLGDVPAGEPKLAFEEQEGWVEVDASWVTGPSFALRVRGDSMVGAGILPEDIVVVRMQQAADDGEIIVARFEDETTVKYLKKRHDGFYLVPANEKYRPKPLRGGNIVGKVVGVLRKY
jgi:repressor LexA